MLYLSELKLCGCICSYVYTEVQEFSTTVHSLVQVLDAQAQRIENQKLKVNAHSLYEHDCVRLIIMSMSTRCQRYGISLCCDPFTLSTKNYNPQPTDHDCYPTH